MRVYVVRKYHGRSSWIDPKHLAKYIGKNLKIDMTHLLIVKAWACKELWKSTPKR